MSTSDDGEGWSIRVVQAAAAVVGVAMIVGALIIRRDEAIAGLVGFGGLFLLAIAAVLPRLEGIKVSPLGIEATLRERAASAKAADQEVEATEVERELSSPDPKALPAPSPDDADVIGTLNFVAGNIALRGVLDWVREGDSALSGCEMRVYLLDEEDGLLKPVLAPEHSVTPWSPGTGAVGTAYRDKQLVLALGAAVSDATYGLTQEQQERYRTLSGVAAVPVFNAAGSVIGVVSAASSDLNNRLGTPAGEEELNLAALLVSRVLIDLMQWFDDN